MRKRVAFVKAIVSQLTLGFGGSGGREGPTMQMGGALGSLVGQVPARHRSRAAHPARRRHRRGHGRRLPHAARRRAPRRRGPPPRRLRDRRARPERPRERRGLLGLHRVLRRADALHPRARSYPFLPAASPALRAPRGRPSRSSPRAFSRRCAWVQRRRQRVAGPGVVPSRRSEGSCSGSSPRPSSWPIGPRLGQPGQGFGILGGGYGAAQLAISGARWFPSGWRGVELLLRCSAAIEDRRHVARPWAAAAARVTSALRSSSAASSAARSARRRSFSSTIRSIDPGAFALVGMGTFYGGLAHVPIAVARHDVRARRAATICSCR